MLVIFDRAFWGVWLTDQNLWSRRDAWAHTVPFKLLRLQFHPLPRFGETESRTERVDLVDGPFQFWRDFPLKAVSRLEIWVRLQI